VETIGSKRSYALTWCMPNNDDDDDDQGLVNTTRGKHETKIQEIFYIPKLQN